MHHGAGKFGGFTFFWEDRHLPQLRLPLFEHGDAFAPRSALRVIDLAQVQYVTLCNTSAL